LVFFIWRKQDLTPTQFREHYETIHMPLLQKLFGDLFPKTHTRNYIERKKAEGVAENDANGNATWTPVLFQDATPDDFDYDVMAIAAFEDEDAFQKFFARYLEVRGVLEEDERRFM
ncbi:hypothetical protein K491DRAFT_582655, partial [Lophiostoma macrostomum CBS 122681]